MLDFIGIGLGPFNLSLASLIHQKSDLQYLFFEQKSQFDWHAGMQLPNTVLQVPFMADLVSMVDPTSAFSFLNYLKHQQRLYQFYFSEQLHIPRSEYNHYCQWVAAQLNHVQYQSTVITISPKAQGFEVVVDQAGTQQHYLCKNLVIGSGNVPYLPEPLADIQARYPEQCIHSAEYMQHRQKQLKGNVVILGSGQSAAEVFLDLFDRQDPMKQDASSFNLHWLTRSNGYFPMEHSPLGLEHFSPDYQKHFFAYTAQAKTQLLAKQALLYKGISAETIRLIYQKLYHGSIANHRLNTNLHPNANLIDAIDDDNHKIKLVFENPINQQQFYLDADYIIAATGYYTPEFNFLDTLRPLIDLDQNQHWVITEDYRVQHQMNGQIYVQNQEISSHGVGVPDLGLGAYRAARIINQLVNDDLYHIDDKQSFQHFNPFNNSEVKPFKPLEHEKNQFYQRAQLKKQPKQYQALPRTSQAEDDFLNARYDDKNSEKNI